MPKASKTTASEPMELDGYEGHFENLDGGYTVGFEHYTEDQDVAALFRGLPDDACQCPHWGVVARGRLSFRFTDGTAEDYVEGDAYYARPGHTPVFTAGTEVVEFSPTVELGQTIEVVTRNMEATAHAT